MKYRMECHTSQRIDILSNPTKKGLSLIIQNMNDSAICGFLKMPPPHKNRPALANATCHQAACVRSFQCPSVRMEYSPGISVCSPSRAVPVLLLSDTAGPRGSKGKCWMCKYKAKRDVMSSFFLFDWNEENTQQKKNELECSLSAVGYLSTSAVKQTSLFLHSGEPGWKSVAGCPTASLESWEFWIPHCHCKLLQGCSPGVGCGTWSPASPAAPRKHLATQKGPATSKAAALCFPAGCSTGNIPTKEIKKWPFICSHKD